MCARLVSALGGVGNEEDPITGLPNRAGLLRRVQEAADARETTSHGEPDTALSFDVARLAAVNDVLGPTAGDALLHALGQKRIDAQLRCGWSRKALGLMGGADLGRTLREAEEALADAKRLRADMWRFASIDPQQRRRQLVLLGSLRQAAGSGGLPMWLQPKVALAGVAPTHCHGFEALVRWRHAEWCMVSPAEFVPFAEAAGMVGVITRCIGHRARRRVGRADKRRL